MKLKSLFIIIASGIMLAACSPFGRPSHAGLQVLTNDVPTSVLLDGQSLGTTPYINKELKPGSYQLRIEPTDPSLTAHETTVTLKRGLLTVVTWKPGSRPETSGGVIYEMEPLSNSERSELSIISLPDGVIVKVDDNPKEFTPVLIEDIEPGQYEFEVSLPSYETQKHTINVLPGHRMLITVKLAKAADSQPSGTAPVSNAVLGENQKKPATETLSSPEPSAQPSAQPSASPAPTNTPTETEDPPVALTGPSVTITSTNYFVSGQEVLRVRDEASAAGEEIGFAVVGESYPYTGRTDQGWYEIEFEGQTGWISGNFATLNR